MLEKHVIADGIHKGSQAFGLAQSAIFAQHREDAGKGLLAHIFDGLGRVEPGAKFELQEPGKIADEVLLRPAITGTEIIDITCVE